MRGARASLLRRVGKDYCARIRPAILEGFSIRRGEIPLGSGRKVCGRDRPVVAEYGLVLRQIDRHGSEREKGRICQLSQQTARIYMSKRLGQSGRERSPGSAQLRHVARDDAIAPLQLNPARLYDTPGHLDVIPRFIWRTKDLPIASVQFDETLKCNISAGTACEARFGGILHIMHRSARRSSKYRYGYVQIAVERWVSGCQAVALGSAMTRMSERPSSVRSSRAAH